MLHLLVLQYQQTWRMEQNKIMKSLVGLSTGIISLEFLFQRM